ncbi:MAG: hydrogenase maturation protease [Lewinellaceae bacterium]|nr:hydrogenase maturation protease [Lewinellaceae bacterium]
MCEPAPNELVILGIGNDSRGDDGLAWAFLDALEGDPHLQAQLLYRYQLQPEDADAIAQAKTVVFVDATKDPLERGFHWQSGLPERQPQVHSHWLPPSAVLGLCQEVFGTCPEAYILAISGEQWELGQGLSVPAKKRLKAALRFFRQWLLLSSSLNPAHTTFLPPR